MFPLLVVTVLFCISITPNKLSIAAGKVEPGPHTSSFNMGYLVSPYGYTNGAAGPIPVSMVSIAICIYTICILIVKFIRPSNDK